MNSVHSFGLFPRAPRFLQQRITSSGYEIALEYQKQLLMLSILNLDGRELLEIAVILTLFVKSSTFNESI